jgi:hypothetical protein
MQKSLTLLLFGFGLVLVSTGAAFAKTEILPVPFGSTTLLFNVNSGRNSPAVQLDRAARGTGSLAAASQPGIPVQRQLFNLGSATLAGALTLLLIQRKRCAANALPSRL